MKLIQYILICCLLGLTSCGGLDNLTQFNKRKYLEKTPKQKFVEQGYVQDDEIPEVYVSTAINPSEYVLEEIPEMDSGQLVLQPIRLSTNEELPISLIEKNDDDESEKVKSVKKRPNLFTLAGITFYAGALISAYFMNPQSSTISLFRTIGMASAGLGFIFILFGFIQVLKHKEKYKLRKFSIWWFVASMIVIVAAGSLAVIMPIIFGGA